MCHQVKLYWTSVDFIKLSFIRDKKVDSFQQILSFQMERSTVENYIYKLSC